ncbi:hypothetical protein ES703_123643 [subsurface metagenome]
MLPHVLRVLCLTAGPPVLPCRLDLGFAGEHVIHPATDALRALDRIADPPPLAVRQCSLRLPVQEMVGDGFFVLRELSQADRCGQGVECGVARGAGFPARPAVGVERLSKIPPRKEAVDLGIGAFRKLFQGLPQDRNGLISFPVDIEDVAAPGEDHRIHGADLEERFGLVRERLPRRRVFLPALVAADVLEEARRSFMRPRGGLPGLLEGLDGDASHPGELLALEVPLRTRVRPARDRSSGGGVRPEREYGRRE